MEGKNHSNSPISNCGLWVSPADLFSSHTKKESITSTPNPSTQWLQFSKNLEDSEGTSKHDSGYCSPTPISAESFRTKCRIRSKVPLNNYAHSTPECGYWSNENDNFSENQSPEFLQTISETRKISHAHRRSIYQYDEPMDTSLYSDDIEVVGHSDSHRCSMGLMDIGEENSIDFADLHSVSSEDYNGIDVSKEKPGDNFRVRPADVYFSAEADIIRCDVSPKFSNETTPTKHHQISSPKISNETTPTKRNKISSPKFNDKTTPTKRFKISSPKFNDETTPTKRNKTSKFKKVANEVNKLNLVIRSFTLNGIEKVDFFYQLCHKLNCPHIVNKILGYLSEKDLDTVRVVSKTWNELIYKDFSSYNRWKLYNSRMRIQKENCTSPVKLSSLGSRRRSVPLSPLHVQNIIQASPPRQSNSPPISPNSVYFNSFARAGRSMKKGERLLRCPKCKFASHDWGSPTVQCSRPGCQHCFCVWCRNEVIPGKDHNCPPLYSPQLRNSSHKIARVGSKSSKRNLRRL